MKALVSQVQTELRLFLRDRTGIFFTVLMPLLMVVFFGYLNRQVQVPVLSPALSEVEGEVEGGEVSYASFLLAGGIGIVIAGASFESLGTTLARQRDDGILKRLGGTPLRAWTLVGAKVLTVAVIILAQTTLMVAVNVFVFEAEITGSLLWTGVVLLVGILAFATMGFALAGLSPNADVAAAAAHAVAFPMQFLCGTLFPIEAMPALLRHIARALPMTYFVDALRGAMLTGGGPGAYAKDWVILLGCLTVSFVIAVKTFRWE